MQRKFAFGIPFSILLFLLTSPSIVSAETMSISYVDSGWYDAAGLHNPLNKNYAVGYDIDNSGFREERNFFVFDLSGVAKPIVSATLTLFEPLYTSDDPSENYELHDVVTSIPRLMAGSGGLAAFDDLGSGVVYGSRTMTAADYLTLVNIPLNSSAIDALNNATGLFAIGGSITTLDYQPNIESAFQYSDLVGMPPGTLQLTFAPEPTSAALIAFAAMIFGSYRARRQT